jgi:cytochrome c peroxidase
MVLAAPLVIVSLGLILSAPSIAAQGSGLTPVEELGKQLFFDTNLSNPKGQSCATCHGPAWGFTGPDSRINATTAVFPGADPTLFGNRKPPSAAYGFSQPLIFDEVEGLWIGGMFWNGRATGLELGDTLAEQARGPFLNPLEMAMPNKESVCIAVMNADYADLFEAVWGAGSLDCGSGVLATYDNIARSIAAYERSAEVNPFSSKFDFYLRGEVQLTGQESKGLDLFNNKAKCALCHLSEPTEDGLPLFTDFTFDNLGVPRNPQNPFYRMAVNELGEDWIDEGLAATLKDLGYGTEVYESELGKQKVPTLRNVDRRPTPNSVKAFGHNGYFKSLESIVHFYNTRDVLPSCGEVLKPKEGKNCWPAAEVPQNVNVDELGNLELTPAEEQALVAFLRTLSDGYQPPRRFAR